MRLSTAYRYKFLKDYKIGIPELITNVVYEGNIIFNESILRKNIGWIPVYNTAQIGQTIRAEASADFSGWSVDINDVGNRVAITARGNDGGGLNAGHTRIYQLSTFNNNNSWVQLGQDIDGEASNDANALIPDLGGTVHNINVSMNAEGDRVAIGAIGNDSNGSNSGHTRIYQLSTFNNNNSWVQLGQDIDGEFIDDYSGYSTSLNSIGDRVVIGAVGSDGSGINAGRTRIYQLSTFNNNNSWVQLGQDIDGEAAYDYSGYSVSINNIGDRVVIGAIGNDGRGVDAGHTRIYQLSTFNNNNSWVQLGQDIDAESAYDKSGYSVSINDIGDRVAIGAIDNTTNGTTTGHTRVYQLSAVNDIDHWMQLGEDINGEIGSDQSGWSVSMNATGDRIAIGSPGANILPNGRRTGSTEIYELTTINNVSNWSPIITDINGLAANDRSGHSVSLNAAGDRVVIGATASALGGTNSGSVRILDLLQPPIDSPFTSFNDENITIRRPNWKYFNNLNVTGGWYDNYNNQFITGLDQLSLSASVSSNRFTQENLYRGYKWIEIATKKNTSISLSSTQSSAIYFKLTGFAPTRKTNSILINWEYNNIILNGENIYNNIFFKVAPNFVTLSSPNIDDIFINYTPEIEPLSALRSWSVNNTNVRFTQNALFDDINTTSSVFCNISALSYKNTRPETAFAAAAGGQPLYIANSSFFNFAESSTSSLKSRLTSVTPLTSTRNLFTVKNHTSNTFIRNTQVWCNDLVDQLTGLVVYKGNPLLGTGSMYSYGGTLITPRHVLYVAHAFPRTENVTFVTTNNTTVSATPVGSADSNTFKNDLPIASLSSVPYYTDIGIVTLDRNVSLSGIHVMPMGAITLTDRAMISQQYIPTLVCSQAPGRVTGATNPNPISASDIQMNINATNFQDMTTAWGSISANPFYDWDINGGGYKLWDGDSGNSHLLLYNNSLYVYSNTYFANGAGAIVSALSGAINHLIDKADQAAGINTGMRPSYYTLDQIINR
jgi:hypothetical protein